MGDALVAGDAGDLAGHLGVVSSDKKRIYDNLVGLWRGLLWAKE